MGDPVLNINFGSGSSDFGPALINSTTYNFASSGTPPDGSYAIRKSTVGMLLGNWHQITNHTPNDPNGYMMIVNADELPGVFYEAEVPIELCPNTTYEFAAWVINLLTYYGNKPNLTFSILTLDNQPLASPYNTGDIMEGSATDWKQYGFLFRTTGNTTRVKIRIINNGPGGNGNDIALDDITFRACGPELIPSIENASTAVQYLCEGDSKDYKFTVAVNGSATLQYQWQINTGNEWNDIQNEVNKELSVSFNRAVKGTYQYRLTAAEPANINSPSCRTVSLPLTIQVNPLPIPILPETAIFCIGDPIQLNLTGITDATYEWEGPNDFHSTDKSPIINNATVQMGGLYKVHITSTAGCFADAQTMIQIVAPTQASVDFSKVEICEGDQVTLSAHGGITYQWTPEIGLSNPGIANPVASPNKTTRYQVRVSNGACDDIAEVEVVVNKKPTASAGVDKAIIEGKSIMLEGKVTGDGVTFYWSPSTGLDNRYKLNPIASPTEDITYTLTASNSTCTDAVDQVSIRVYQKLIIPNTFSPNGDGVNDLWNLPAINTYRGVKVMVMNRYGQEVFKSSGYEIPWNGKYQNQDVPVGVYYYVIHLESGLKPLTGSLTVIR